MKLTTLESVFGVLNAAGARYLMVGGLAVNAHGYERLTMDVDLGLLMSSDNLRKALKALAGLSFRPMLPVDILDLAHAETREDGSRTGTSAFSRSYAMRIRTRRSTCWQSWRSSLPTSTNER